MPATGYTVVELLVAAALLALMLGLAIPSWQSYLQRRQLEGLSARLLADLHQLRSSSAARGEALRLSLDTTQGCYLIHSGAHGDCRCERPADGPPLSRCQPGADALRVQALQEGSWRLSANVTTLALDPRHGTVSPTASLEWAHPGGLALRHIINILGRVRVCSSGPAQPAYNAC